MSGAAEMRDWLEERLQSERAVIAHLWALPPALAASPRTMAAAMLQPENVRAALAQLGGRERAALELVQAHAGVVAAAVLEREYGGVREVANYANPRAYLLALAAPPEPTERLFVLGFLQLLTNGTNRSYAIPSDLLAALPATQPLQTTLNVLPAAAPDPSQPGEFTPIEQDLLTLIGLADAGEMSQIPTGGLNKASLVKLAGEWQPGKKLSGVSREEHIPYLRFLRTLAEAAGFLRSAADGQLRPTRAALEWMQLPPLDRSRQLLDAYIAAPFDELVTFRRFSFAHAYGRDLARAKRSLIRLLAPLEAATWYSFADLVAAVKRVEPDFARPSGRYDTWGIRDYCGNRLDGFEHWEAVEGEQIRGIFGSLGWLNLADIAIEAEQFIHFRLTPLGAALISGAPAPAEPPAEPLVIQANFAVLVPPSATLYHRFEIRRIASRSRRAEVESFTLTKQALQAALERGSSFAAIEQFLHDASGRPLPQNVAATMREWAGQHGRVALRRAVLLETSDSALMQQIQHDKRLRFPEAERLTDTSYTVREGDAAALAERMRKSGYGLTGGDFQPDVPLSERDLTVLMAALDFYERACSEFAIESDASVALLRRVAKLLPEKQLNRAYQSSAAALAALRQAVDQRLERATHGS